LLQHTGLKSDLVDGVLTISLIDCEQAEIGCDLNNLHGNESGKGKRMNTNKRKNLLATFVTMFAAGATTQGAMAQTDSAAEQSRIDEIVVTASKRETSLQDTAMSITAIGNKEIGRRGLVGMADYLPTIPGVSMVDRGPGRSGFVMRGISTNPQSTLRLGNTVDVYLGDIPLTGNSTFGGTVDIKLIDTERVEVLRGPQGTLYGGGSLAGAIRNIPVAPDLQQFSGTVKADYSVTGEQGSDNNKIEAIINVPIIENELAVRIATYRHENSGYIDNVGASNLGYITAVNALGIDDALLVDQDDRGSDEYVGGRITALWQPNDKFKAKLTYLTQDIEQDGHPEVQLREGLGDYEQTRILVSDLVLGGGSERLEDDIDIFNVELQYDLSWASVLSSSSWTDESSLMLRDLSANFITPFSEDDSLSGLVPFPQGAKTDAEMFIQELRLTSQLDGPWQYVAGLYYRDLERVFDQTLFLGATNLGNGDITNITQKAVFGELSYAINEQLKITLGGRKFDYTVDVSGRFRDGGTTQLPSIDSTEDGTIAKANITYEPNDDFLFYVQWSEGFRFGVPLPDLPANNCDVDNDGLIDSTNFPISGRSLESDRTESFELGGKFSFQDSRLIVNASLYQTDWKDIPLSVSVNTGLCNTSVPVNGGTATSQGVELEARYRVSENLEVTLATSYVEAELTSDVPDIGGVDGDRLPGSPRYNVATGLQYEFDLAGYSAYLRGDYAYIGGFYNNVQESGIEVGNYGLLSVSAGMDFEQWSIGLSAANLTNQNNLTWIDTFGGADARASRLRPRTIGLNVNYHF